MQDDHYVISQPPEDLLRLHQSSFSCAGVHTKFVIYTKNECSKSSCSYQCRRDEKRSSWIQANDHSVQALDLSFNKSFESQAESVDHSSSPRGDVGYWKKDENERRASFSVRNIISLPERSSPPPCTLFHSNLTVATSDSSSIAVPAATRPSIAKGLSFDSKIGDVRRMNASNIKKEISECCNIRTELGEFLCGSLTPQQFFSCSSLLTFYVCMYFTKACACILRSEVSLLKQF